MSPPTAAGDARRTPERPQPSGCARSRVSHADGFLTVEYLAATALSVLLFTVLANLVVLQLGRGVVRADLEEAARAGSRTVASVEEALAVCRRTAARGRGLRPFTTQGEDVTIDCAAADGRVVVTARILLRGWLPGMPDHLVTERASAPREVLP